MKLILLGYMGSGKSTVGRAVAQKLQIPFLDLDDEISKTENKSISQIFSKKGEIYFRKLESKILKELLESDTHFVLALGGGTPCYGQNLQHILDTDATSVYLKLGLQQLQHRLSLEKAKRPLIAHLETPEVLEDFIRKHLFERSYYYNQAGVIINCDNKSVSEIATEILTKLD